MISFAEFLKLDPVEQRLYFEKAASVINLPLALIEKDFWISFLLEIFFKRKDIGAYLTFKGGTSLSKVFNLIRRFSEDIDLSIEKTYFGFSGDAIPERASSGKKSQLLLEQLQLACQDYVANELLTSSRDDISVLLPDTGTWKLDLDNSDGSQTIIFTYPSITTQKLAYIVPSVKIELGARAEHWPVEQCSISSYVHHALPDVLEPWTFTIQALSVSRTFWEKATILHMYANYPENKLVPLRQSRHYYDLYALLTSGVKESALRDVHLLRDVCKHKSVYFRSAAARYDEAVTGNLRLMPSGEVLRSMQRDYQQMGEMFFDEPIKFEVILEALREFEEIVNKMIESNI